MVIQQNGGQCRSIDTVFLLFRNLSRQFWVQGVNTLHHQYFVALQTQSLATTFTHSRMEVIARQFHLLATQQCVHLLVQQGNVECMQMFEVIVATGITRCLVARHEIIVQRDTDRFDAIHSQLY